MSANEPANKRLDLDVEVSLSARFPQNHCIFGSGHGRLAPFKNDFWLGSFCALPTLASAAREEAGRLFQLESSGVEQLLGFEGLATGDVPEGACELAHHGGDGLDLGLCRAPLILTPSRHQN